MNKILVLDNLNTINYIIQNCMNSCLGMELVERNDFVVGEGYAMDVRFAGKKKYNLHIRTSLLTDLCRIHLESNRMVVRYNHKFMFFYNPKTDLYSTNLFNEPFTLDEMEAVFFTQNTLDAWGLQVDFDFDVMQKTLSMCRRIYNEFLFSHQI